jgi:hypothetical protein
MDSRGGPDFSARAVLLPEGALTEPHEASRRLPREALFSVRNSNAGIRRARRLAPRVGGLGRGDRGLPAFRPDVKKL